MIRGAILCALLMLAACAAPAADWYVATTGNNSNSGTIGSPLRDIAAAIDSADPGDNIWIRTGTYAENINTSKSGGSTTRISVSSYNGESVTVKPSSGTAWIWTGADNWNMSNMTIAASTAGFGRAMNWTNAGSDSMTFTNVIFLADTTSSASYQGVYFSGDGASTWGDLHHGIKFIHCQFRENKYINIGNNDGTADLFGAYDGTGILLYECHFEGTDHYAINWMVQWDQFVVIRCTFTRGHGFIDFGKGKTRNVLLEGNVMWNGHAAGSASGDYWQGGADTMIVRLNRGVYRNNDNDPNGDFQLFGINLYQNDMRASFATVYHNTIAVDLMGDDGMNQVIGYSNQKDSPDATLDSAFFWNNIVEFWNPYSGANRSTVLMLDTAKDAISDFKVVWQGNRLFIEDSGGSDSLVRIKYNGASQWPANLALAKSTLPNIFLAGNKDWPSGLTITAGDDTALTLPDTSSCRGGAIALTVTTNAGSGSTTMTVGRACFFTDGWGLIPADTIFVAGMTPNEWVPLSDVVYINNTLTLATSSTWSSGADVFLWKNGGKMDDVGAVQYVTAGASAGKYSIGFKP